MNDAQRSIGSATPQGALAGQDVAREALPAIPQDARTLAAALADSPSGSARSIDQWVVERGLVTPEELMAARGRRTAGETLCETLVRLAMIDEETMHRARAAALATPFVRADQFALEPDATAALTASLARQHAVIPLCMADGRLVIACSDPTDAELERLLAFGVDQPVTLVLARSSDIHRAIVATYGPGEDAAALREVCERSRERGNTAGDLGAEQLARKGPVVRLVNHLLSDAIRQGASDVHLRPLEEEVEVLYRIDGQLLPLRRIDKTLLPALTSRIKIIGGMDIAEHRVPQDGRARTVVAGHEVDLRISIIPVVTGESVVVRILDASVGLRDLDELGFTTSDQQRFDELLRRSTGLILVTGPTGCGKSTTLHAALNALRPTGAHIITVENPVEHRLEGVNQIDVNPATGLTFPRTLRHILRHDPDVVMIGEIRDAETAKIAVEASLTGHLVLSTLHTNDAPSAVTRLLEIGIEPWLVGASLLGVLAQRLVRRNCPSCTGPEAADDAMRAAVGAAPDEPFEKGRGCHLCHETGYAGRHAVYELLVASPALREAIVTSAPASEIARLAQAEGMVPLTRNALALARRRVTSLAEVVRVRTG